MKKIGKTDMIEDKKLRFLITETGFTLETAGALDPADDSLQFWYKAFKKDKYKALYDLGFQERPAWLDKAGAFLYLIADSFQKYLLRQPDIELLRDGVGFNLDEDMEERLNRSIPFSPGTEYIDRDWFNRVFEHLHAQYALEIKNFQGSVQLYVADKSQHLRVPERIFFHLVENREEPDYPFAFMATYSTRIKGKGISHKPLQYALTEYKTDRDKLLILLSCLNRVSEVSPLIGEFVRSGEMFHPLRLTAPEAYQFLKDVPAIEKTGIICRIPNWWKRNASQIFMNVNIGQDKVPLLGLESMIAMVPELTVDGVPLTKQEIERLLAETEGLAYLKGRWVEVDHARLTALLETMDDFYREISLKDALRLQLGESPDSILPDVGPLVSNGKWLNTLLLNMRSPAKIRKSAVPRNLRATLRPYQNTGFTWLNYMNKLGFGACLADDMGLGKTVQILAFLLKLAQDNKNGRVLLIVPASLLGNWEKEIEKFTPKLNHHILHGGGKDKGKALIETPSFLTITTYGTALRVEELDQITWDAIILDEAQAIKNPVSKQTRRIKTLKGRMRIAMTGTPIENDLSNLWSLFDFLNKGLLGSSTEFHEFCNKLDADPAGYARLKAMISPFMLRRLKTDKSIISDLPDKIEQIEYVGLSKKQTVLYRKYVMDLEQKLHNQMTNMERRGLVLASLIKLKQICNHPDQYLGQTAYEEKDSGKFGILRDICETIYEKRERVLIFTQFKEIIPYLDDYLAAIFHRRGLTLHGGTHVKTRAKLVEEFQGEDYVPYMILSVKAGGTGLNLTKASHVIHFDRWWNPAVENQATDRAFRIGQKNNVVVHKFVCERTIEEKINTLIESKKELAENVVGSGSESWITEMNNEELINIFRLD
ncbi:MAG: DEAD/DEAH box helicase [Lachnospiraceae bacterium]|nr:DEAD/DEAH box helicase [Lachnospiraceae bacterium]